MQKTAIRVGEVMLVMGAVMINACSATYDPGGFVPNGGETDAGRTGGGAGGAGGGSVAAGCSSNADCGVGFTCVGNACVAPEQETNRSLSNAPPVATPHYVFALNPSAASAARIDPATLIIEAIPVGPKPVSLAALPGEDAAVVLSYDDASLSIIDSSVSPSKVTRVALKRQYARLSVSPDGVFAVAWPEPSIAPTSGAEGIFALVDLAGARQGLSSTQVVTERAGGYRITDVIFRTENGHATKMSVFAKSTVSTFDLVTPTSSLPARVALPASMSAEVGSREVVASADGAVILLRSTTEPELASFDGMGLTVVTLPEVATDLDLLPDGSAAIAALRTAGSVAYVRIPQDLISPAGIQVFPVSGGGVGQVSLPPTSSSGLFAFVYSNVTGDESFARIDLPSGTVTRYPLEKLVDEVTVSPDSKSAVIIHRSNSATTASDPYEAQVDRDEGFTVFDVASGFSQLQRTGTTQPTRYAFSPTGGFVGVALRNDQLRRYALQAVNLSSLVSTTLTLASAPLFMGTVPQAPGITPNRVFVSQDHPAGRISVIALDSGQVRTATGFTLNGDIR